MESVSTAVQLYSSTAPTIGNRDGDPGLVSYLSKGVQEIGILAQSIFPVQ